MSVSLFRFFILPVLLLLHHSQRLFIPFVIKIINTITINLTLFLCLLTTVITFRNVGHHCPHHLFVSSTIIATVIVSTGGCSNHNNVLKTDWCQSSIHSLTNKNQIHQPALFIVMQKSVFILFFEAQSSATLSVPQSFARDIRYR